MKRIIFAFWLLLVLSISAHAQLYTCTDGNGRSIVTDSPQDGMRNCVPQDDSVQSFPEEQKQEKPVVKKDDNGVKSKNTPEARNARIKKCLDCCQDKFHACYNYTADNRLCTVEAQNCVATCNSEGSSPSSWSYCWSLSDG